VVHESAERTPHIHTLTPPPHHHLPSPPLFAVCCRGTVITHGCWYFTCTVVVPGPGAVGVARVTPGAPSDSLGDRWVLRQVQGGSGPGATGALRVESPSGATISLPGPTEGSRLEAWRAGDVVCFALDTHSGVLTVTLWSRWPAPGGWTSPKPAMYADGVCLPRGVLCVCVCVR
jgi:hypothetical protein